MKTAVNTMQIFWHHTWNHKVRLFTMLLLIPTLVIAEGILIPLLTSQILDSLTQPAGKSLSDFKSVLLIMLGLEIYILLFWRVAVIQIWALQAQVIEKELAPRCFAFLMRQSQRFHADHFGGALVSQTNKFLGAYERLGDVLMFQVYTLFIFYIASIFVLWTRAPEFVMAMVALSTLMVAAIVYTRLKQVPLNKAEAYAENRRTAQLADSITNISTVKTFAREDHEDGLFDIVTEKTKQATLSLMRMSMKHEVLTASLNRSLSFAALLISIVLILSTGAKVGVLFLVFAYTGNILSRLWDLQFAFKQINRSFGDAYEMTELLQETPEVLDPEEPKPFKPGKGKIEFDDVTFKYADARAANTLFDHLNLTIKAGEKIGLVGPSGGGKTTVTKLLLRFMDIDSGAIKVDGQNIAEVTQQELRQAISYVPQEPILFHRTLADNIAYGNPRASLDEIKDAARKAHAHEFIESLPDGYGTFVGERGVKLSGGQRQRIAIARAMLKNANILVLDEATSALDSESEKYIHESLDELMKGRTSIVIAHRLSTIQKMDRIIVLDEGQITEEGTHAELLKQNGTYAKLWGHQSGGFLEE